MTLINNSLFMIPTRILIKNMVNKKFIYVPDFLDIWRKFIRLTVEMVYKPFHQNQPNVSQYCKRPWVLMKVTAKLHDIWLNPFMSAYLLISCICSVKRIRVLTLLGGTLICRRLAPRKVCVHFTDLVNMESWANAIGKQGRTSNFKSRYNEEQTQVLWDCSYKLTNPLHQC